ncbi:MAG: BhlA/UviB family holin-like peptide [Clostridium sp.]
MEQELLTQIISQGAFASLFIWLFIDTRKDSKSREDKYLNTIDKLADKINIVEEIKEDMKEIKEDVEEIKIKLK